MFGGPLVVAFLGLWEWQDHSTAHRKRLKMEKARREGRVYVETYCCGLLKKKVCVFVFVFVCALVRVH